MQKILILLIGTVALTSARFSLKAFVANKIIKTSPVISLMHDNAQYYNHTQQHEDTYHIHYDAQDLKNMPQDGFQFTEGLLGGLLQTDMSAMDQCQSGAFNIFDKLNSAIHDFSQKSLSGVIEGCEDLYAAIKDLPTELQTCEQIKDQLVLLEAWIKKFEHPIDMSLTISKNFFWNAGAVYGDIESGMSSWNTQQFKASGQKFGETLYVLTK
ncbi:UNKNOWN [Stylonychia lemnae]|uniref:Uncharacterized protein n=1 Tax=Stylonychia lemnae TaxID=5949 RepID=A0A078AUW1_STYLE|nr:UNKNOWN [Stylonychia lemnae]|eukprot:CDW85994.1 UNKNOWN [Stylonychia lemnae]